MSNVSKGTTYERKARKMLESKGFKVDFKYRTRFHQDTDLFGLWDFIAINEDLIALVQVKTDISSVSKFKKKSIEFMNLYGDLPIEYIIVMYTPRKKDHRVWGWIKNKWVEV